LGGVSATELAIALNASHSAGLFEETLLSRVSDAELSYELDCAASSQYIHNMHLCRVVGDIVKVLPALRVPPVVLKGPGLWGWLYPQLQTRKTRDLDLLISHPDDLPVVVDSLIAHGFRFESDDVDLLAVGHYEIGALVRDDELQLDAKDAARVDHLLELCPSRPDFQRISDGNYRIRLEIEVHKGIFLLSDGSLPVIESHFTCPSELFPGARRLTIAAQLPYLATKFGMDAEGTEGAPPQAQSLKLLADVVRMIERATPQSISDSVAIARSWRCGGYYARTAATAAPLLPEAEFRGVSSAPPFPLDPLFDRLCR
jgi:hypothetical protein